MCPAVSCTLILFDLLINYLNWRSTINYQWLDLDWKTAIPFPFYTDLTGLKVHYIQADAFPAFSTCVPIEVYELFRLIIELLINIYWAPTNVNCWLWGIWLEESWMVFYSCLSRVGNLKYNGEPSQSYKLTWAIHTNCPFRMFYWFENCESLWGDLPLS